MGVLNWAGRAIERTNNEGLASRVFFFFAQLQSKLISIFLDILMLMTSFFLQDGIKKKKVFWSYFNFLYCYSEVSTEQQRYCCSSPSLQTLLYHPGGERHDYSDFLHMRNDRACLVHKAAAGKGLLVNTSSFLSPDSLPVLPGASKGKWIRQ